MNSNKLDLLESVVKEQHGRVYSKIKEYHRGGMPVDIRALCEAVCAAEGVQVKVMHRDLGRTMSGGIRRFDDTNYAIAANSKESRVRQRFTLAHELAHFILHRQLLEETFPESLLLRGGLPTTEEIEANRLGAEILMPIEAIDAYIEDNPNFNLIGMAKHFNVSAFAMSVRLGIPIDS